MALRRRCFSRSLAAHVILVVVIARSGTAVAAAASDPELDTLPARRAIPPLTQALLDALPRDSVVWERYLSDSAVYVSEAGEVAGKRELLEGFGPFPAGITGSIQVVDPRIVDLGDLAICVFTAQERQSVYGQPIQVSYRSTHTWRRERGRWRLVAAQNLALARDPEPLPADRSRWADIAGTYELTEGRRYRIEHRDGALSGGREGGPLTALIPLGDNVFAESGSNLGILRIFVRGEAGTVDRMIQRRKFADVSWRKVAAK